jgi:hypothetical protein
MKLLFSTLILLTAVSAVVAQNNLQDVVYLKNGQVLRGVIMEQVPGQSIKMETPSGSVFVLRMEEIDRISKEATQETTNTIAKSGLGERERRGYLGPVVGVALPSGDDMTNFKPGLSLQLLQFGYLFSKNVGITVSWGNASNKNESGSFKVGTGGFMIGPMFSIPSGKIVIDFRPQVGYQYSAPSAPLSGAWAFSYSLGANLRYHLMPKMALLLGIDYFSTRPDFGFSDNPHINTIRIGGGVALRLK